MKIKTPWYPPYCLSLILNTCHWIDAERMPFFQLVENKILIGFDGRAVGIICWAIGQ